MLTNAITNAAATISAVHHETAGYNWEAIAAVSTFALALFTALMTWATFRLGSDSLKASENQIAEWGKSTAAQIKTWEQTSVDQIGVQTWLTLEARFDSKEMRRARNLLSSRIVLYNTKHNHHALVPEQVLELFESISTVYGRDLINKHLAESSFSYHAQGWWDAAKTYIHDERQKKHDASLFFEFEKFAKTMNVKYPLGEGYRLGDFLAEEGGLET